jgi:hypothetical protein
LAGEPPDQRLGKAEGDFLGHHTAIIPYFGR